MLGMGIGLSKVGGMGMGLWYNEYHQCIAQGKLILTEGERGIG